MARARRVAARAAIVAMLALCAGCASIPLGTLWQMRNFGPEQLQALDPQQLRVAGRIDPAPLRFRPGTMQLKLSLTPRAEGRPVEEHVFGLRESSVFAHALVPRGEPRWQVFELDADGVAAMRRLQPRLGRVKDDYSGFGFSVQWKVDGQLPAAGSPAFVNVRMQLATEQAPFTLIDRLRVEVGKD